MRHSSNSADPEATMTIQRKISLGYGLVMGLVFGGTAIGLVIGNHYQHQALALSRAATGERRLLSELQIQILYNRPTKQLSPYLEDPVAFHQESNAFLERLKNIQVELATYRTHQEAHHIHHSYVNEYHPELAQNLHALLHDYEETVERFIVRFETFIQETSSLIEAPGDPAQARERLLALTTSPEFVAFVEFSDQLEPFYIEVGQLGQQAEAALSTAETFRNRIILISLGLSGVISAAIALFTSRTVAHPLELATRLARQVAEEENFNLEVPVISRDETGILAHVLNKLIRQVRALFIRLEEKNKDLQAALDSLNQQGASHFR